jgi:hypothetical protein
MLLERKKQIWAIVISLWKLISVYFFRTTCHSPKLQMNTWLFCIISIILIQFPSQTLLQHDGLNNFVRAYSKFYSHVSVFKHEALVIQANENHNEAVLRIVRHNLNEIRPFLKALDIGACLYCGHISIFCRS